MSTAAEDIATADRTAEEIASAVFGGGRKKPAEETFTGREWVEVPLHEDLQCRARVELRQLLGGGWNSDVEYKWVEGVVQWRPATTKPAATRHEALLIAARMLVDYFGVALGHARLSREAQECVGKAITGLAKFRNELEIASFCKHCNPPPEKETMPAKSLTAPPPAVTANKAKRDRRKARRETKRAAAETNGHAGDGRPTQPGIFITSPEMTGELVLDPEFQALSLVFTAEEAALLLESCRRDKIRDPLLVWPETPERLVLVDGHRRLAIAQRYDLAYAVKAVPFKTRAEALTWCRDQQLARRNLTEEQKSYLRGKAYLAEKSGKGVELQSGKGGDQAGARPRDAAGGLPLHGSTGDSVSPRKPRRGNAAAKIAKAAGVSTRTVKRDAKFAAAVDKLPPQEKAETLAGKGKTKRELTGQKNKTSDLSVPDFSVRKGSKPTSLQTLADVCGLAGPKVMKAKDLGEWRRLFFREQIIARLDTELAVNLCARVLGLDCASHWRQLQERDAGRVQEWLELHDKQGVERLAEFFQVFVEKGRSKEQIVKLIMARKLTRPLPLPTSLYPLDKEGHARQSVPEATCGPVRAAKSGGSKGMGKKKAKGKKIGGKK